ncbi:uncharacterized protein F5147DRAFT_725043 [Suillus discolor]|uniref:Uncharacterized protein n=1 Tax=Suillus discolor TaxID=1912936 RepID=A0A9P7ETY3_9AGAM|nr:uncharacterized protein F5147DRAFT_725043 [Suillus discolor]KAG2090099.1 hypothetical protein F5147DRAFT_725043 [Suillus discolor]
MNHVSSRHQFSGYVSCLCIKPRPCLCPPHVKSHPCFVSAVSSLTHAASRPRRRFQYPNHIAWLCAWLNSYSDAYIVSENLLHLFAMQSESVLTFGSVCLSICSTCFVVHHLTYS